MTNEKVEELIDRLSFYYTQEGKCRRLGWEIAADSWAAGALGFVQGVAQGVSLTEAWNLEQINDFTERLEQEARKRAEA